MLFEVLVGEFDILRPIVEIDVVAALADMVGNIALGLGEFYPNYSSWKLLPIL